MELKSLQLQNFRNYRKVKLPLHPKLNLIWGLNGQGKTNLIEAICYLSMFSSFRTNHSEDMVLKGEDYFFIGGEFEGEGTTHSLKTTYDKHKKKMIKMDGNIKRHLSDVIGSLNTVLFSPDDLYLFKSGPESRRNFLNREIVQMAPKSYYFFQRYNKALRQRNFLLKNSGSEDILDSYDKQLAENGSYIYAYRKEAVDRLLPLARLSHRRLSEGKEELLISYENGFDSDFWKKAKRDDIEKSFLDALEERRKEDFKRGYTTFGPHRDDLKFTLNGESLVKFGSQGQQRTAILALKLGEMELMKGQRGEYPILLLDDVLSELDNKRREALISVVNGRIQTVITGTEPHKFNSDNYTFLIKDGEIFAQD